MSGAQYKGIIIEESLDGPNFLKSLNILSQEVSDDLTWHMDTVLVTKRDIEMLSNAIKQGAWYMHFWKDRDVVAVFKGNIFHFNFDDKNSWKPAIAYGKSLGIPAEQLDFPIE